MNGLAKLVALLLQKGANPNAQTKEDVLGKMTQMGVEEDVQPNLLLASRQTPLHMAIANQHSEVVSVFLEHRSMYSAEDKKSVYRPDKMSFMHAYFLAIYTELPQKHPKPNYSLTSSHWMSYKPTNFCWDGPIGERLYTHSDFVVFCRKTCKHAARGVPLWRLTCIHAIVSQSPWGHG